MGDPMFERQKLRRLASFLESDIIQLFKRNNRVRIPRRQEDHESIADLIEVTQSARPR
jgi:hypothetical protein